MSRIGFSVEAMVDWRNTDLDGDGINDDSHTSTIGSATEIVVTKVTFDSNNGLANSGKVKWGVTTQTGYLLQENSEYFKEELSLVEWLRQFSPNEQAE